MILIKTLIITSILCSFSVRSPVRDVPFDYELRSGLEYKIDKYSIKSKILFLYEREEGISGFGSELWVIYEKKDKYISDLLNIEVYYKRKFESFERSVNKISMQAIDTGYIINDWLDIGYSIGWNYWKNPILLIYFMLNFDWLKLETRIGLKKRIITLKIWNKIQILDKIFFIPKLEIRNDGLKKYYFSKLEMSYKI